MRGKKCQAVPIQVDLHETHKEVEKLYRFPNKKRNRKAIIVAIMIIFKRASQTEIHSLEILSEWNHQVYQKPGSRAPGWAAGAAAAGTSSADTTGTANTPKLGWVHPNTPVLGARMKLSHTNPTNRHGDKHRHLKRSQVGQQSFSRAWTADKNTPPRIRTSCCIKKKQNGVLFKGKKNKSWLGSEYGRLVKSASLPREWKDTGSSGVSYQQRGAAKQTLTGLPTTLRMRL